MAERYKKTGGAADGAGESYEWKILTLFYIRMLSARLDFNLASNMQEAGLFDDVVIKHRKHLNDPWIVTCLQLKHKQKKIISKTALLGISGDFSLVKYSASFASVRNSEFMELDSSSQTKFIIFTNAKIAESLVDPLVPDELINTNGKAVCFKLDGEVYQELCEWVDFKEALIELLGQVEGMSDEQLVKKIKKVLKKVEYQNKAVTSYREELLKVPTMVKLKEILKKLEIVGDKETYALFLGEVRLYTQQAHESQLDAKIKEELDKIWLGLSDHLEAEVMLSNLKDRIKAWWQKENVYLTQNSPLWLDTVKTRTQVLSRSTTDELTQRGVEFSETSLRVLFNKFEQVVGNGGILNLRVDSKTTASSLKVWQTLTRFGDCDSSVIHVNLKAFLAREDDVLSVWATRWCQILVVECDEELDRKQAARISARVLKVVTNDSDKKLLVLIAPEMHEINVQLRSAENYTRFNDNFSWSELERKSQETFLSCQIAINGTTSPQNLAELLGDDKGFVNKADLDVISQLLKGDVHCGTELDGDVKFFVTRQLLADGVPFVVNSVRDVPGKVVLVVAEPGMGKSTLFTHLVRSAKVEHPSSWVLHLKLNNCTQHLKTIDVDNFDQVTAREFLERSGLGSRSWFERLLFQSLQRKLFVFIDGVDEVCPHYEKEVFTLLGFLRDMQFCQLWVASRPVFQAKLEEKLGVKTFCLAAFSRDDLKEFFTNIWTTKNPLMSSERCSKATDRLLAWLTNSLGKDNYMLGVPLMASMIAETFEDRMTSELAKGEFFKSQSLDIMNLHKMFVRKKFDLYCVEKKKATSRELAANISDERTLMNQMHYNHQLAALRALFRPEDISNLHFEGKARYKEDLTTYLQDVVDGREKMGIIDNVIDGLPHFVHRSFAEFFAATWLAKNFKDNNAFIELVLFNPAYGRISEMFHRSLAENCNLHLAVLNGDLTSVQHALTKQWELDAGGRTPLHLAVLLRNFGKHQDGIHIVLRLARVHKASLQIADAVLGWTPIQYAERALAWDALDLLLLSTEKTGRLNTSQPKPYPSVMLDAAKHASTAVVRYLVKERGGKLDCRSPDGSTMMHMAAEGQNAGTVRYIIKTSNTVRHLLDRVPGWDVINSQGLTALQISAQKGAKEVMIVLLEVKVSYKLSPYITKASDMQLGTSLLCAAFVNNLEYVKTLVKLGASVGHRDDLGHTAAWVAMTRENTEVMHWLLRLGAENGDTLLHAACRQGEVEIAAVLLSSGGDIEARGYSEQTPLAAAAEKGHLALAELLLDSGATVECRDLFSLTPLHSASTGGYEEIADLLLRHGADIGAQDKSGRTPLHSAIWGKQHNVVELLLANAANLECCDGNGWTPLHTAAINNELSVLKLLVEKGASLECRDANGWTPLHAASSTGREQIASLLLSVGADIAAVNHRGRTPLHVAAWSQKVELVEKLLEHGADLECKDNDGWTALHIASTHKELDVLEFLLARGANLESRDNKGNTPQIIADTQGYGPAAAMLLRFAAGGDLDRTQSS